MKPKSLLSFCIVALAAFATANADVHVIAPAAGMGASSPVHVVATATAAISTNKITRMQVYVDYVGQPSVYAGRLDQLVTMASGTHRLVVQAWDSVGTVYKFTTTLTVADAPTVPSSATVFHAIDDMSAWADCDVCSGSGGAGVTTVHWLAQNLTTPAVDGGSAEFYLQPSTSYASALWWKQLGPLDTASHFFYSGDFYFTDATAPQALEFDMNQSLNGYKFVFGTECDFRGTIHNWRVWDASLRWTTTNIPCTPTAANTWHHFQWEFERTTDNHTRFVAITVDGVRTTVNAYYNPLSSTAHELNVAVQLDGNKSMIPFGVWVDNLTLSAW